jgi:hypothetical protein
MQTPPDRILYCDTFTDGEPGNSRSIVQFGKELSLQLCVASAPCCFDLDRRIGVRSDSAPQLIHDVGL